MPPKPKKTREEVISAAVDIVRRDGLGALSARRLGEELSVAPSSVFTHFASMDELESATVTAIRDIYDAYFSRGLEMTPPFKGFGLSLVHFAADNPKLFSALFIRKSASRLGDVIELEGHKAEVLSVIEETFGLSPDDAEKLYIQLWVYVTGLASLMVMGVCSFSDEELSSMLGSVCRGMLISISAPSDSMTDFVPGKGKAIDRDVSSYIKI